MIERGYKPRRESEPLVCGSEMHRLLEAHDNNEPTDTTDILANVLINGYKKHWNAKQFQYLEIEKEFEFPLVNPKTGGISKTFVLAGKIDAIVKDIVTDQISVLEHKTTREDISNPVSNYWAKLSQDPQITGYYLAGEQLGYNIKNIIYDVIGKPTIKPYTATPVEDRRYKKTGELYANQRDTDESQTEYALRLRQSIIETPSRYYQRKDIPRIDTDIVEYLSDMWAVAKQIMHSREEQFYPRRANQCFNYGRCPFFDVCAKCASLEDEAMFTKIETKNPELAKEVEYGN
jgi:hypothetical protein